VHFVVHFGGWTEFGSIKKIMQNLLW